MNWWGKTYRWLCTPSNALSIPIRKQQLNMSFFFFFFLLLDWLCRIIHVALVNNSYVKHLTDISSGCLPLTGVSRNTPWDTDLYECLLRSTLDQYPCWEWKQDWAKWGVKEYSDYNKGPSNPLGNSAAKTAFQWHPKSSGGGGDRYSLPPTSQRKMIDLWQCGINCGKEAFFGGGNSGGSQRYSYSICHSELKQEPYSR